MSSEAVVASGLGLLSVLCEKQHPEFLAITHAHPSTRAILSALLALATREPPPLLVHIIPVSGRDGVAHGLAGY